MWLVKFEEPKKGVWLPNCLSKCMFGMFHFFSLSLSLSLSPPLSLFVILQYFLNPGECCLSVSISLTVFLCLSVCLCIFLSLSIYLSLSPLFICQFPIFLESSRILSVCLFLVFLYLPFCLLGNKSLFLYLSLFIPLCLSVCLSFSVLYLSVCLSLSLFVSLQYLSKPVECCLSVYFSLYLYLSHSMFTIFLEARRMLDRRQKKKFGSFFCFSLSLSLYLSSSFCLSLSVFLSLYLSVYHISQSR
jgi:hypothetical protein